MFTYGVARGGDLDEARNLPAIANAMDTVFSFPAPATFPVGLAIDGTSLWISDVDSNCIHKVSSTGQLLKTLRISERVGFLLWVAPRLWGVNEQLARIVEIDTLTGNTHLLFRSPDTASSDPNPSGLAWDGNNLWLSVYLSSPRIYRLSPTNGAAVDSFQAPAATILGITYADGFLYGVDVMSARIFKMNPSNGQAADSASWQVPYPLGLVWDGSYFQNVSGATRYGGTARVYKVSSQITSIADDGTAAHPSEFVLYQNLPNPFNPMTVISYQLPVASDVKLAVYDLLGREVKVLVAQMHEAGYHQASLDGSGMASGPYFCRMVAQPTNGAKGYVAVKKILLLK